MSMEASSSSSAFQEEDENQISQLHSSPQASAAHQAQSSSAYSNSLKRKRNQPGNPNPDVEVIALTPKTLMATNRFVCEVCNKGFQREQNLQLHRRGHNLPWKLKQKKTKDVVRKKVYLCPEPTCVHHDPARALGDLTGIKKHYSRKHGEKRFKCERCSKKYAVHSDWKAHSKTCGTREYRCDCGTLFSGRDSFITHRAFCDALAQERMVHQPPAVAASLLTGGIGSHHLLGLGTTPPRQDHHHHNLLHLGRASPQIENLIGQGPSFQAPSPPSSQPRSLLPHSSSNLFVQPPQENQQSSSSFHGLMQSPQPNNNNTPNGGFFNLGFYPNSDGAGGGIEAEHHHSSGGGDESNIFSSGILTSTPIPSLYSTSQQAIALQNSGGSSAHMSATALLQKAAQMGSTTTTTSDHHLLKTFSAAGKSTNFGPTPSSSMPLFFSHNDQNSSSHNLHDLMTTITNNIGSSSSIFHDHRGEDMDQGYRGLFIGNNKDVGFDDEGITGAFNGNNNLEHGTLTRDFLGVGEVLVRSVREQNSQQQQQHGNMASLDHSQGNRSGSVHQDFGAL